ncbi:MAG: urease accessory protein UreF [Oscillospiraceae bacterium]
MTTNIITMNNTGFIFVMQALDSLFPIGAFTLSNGMETYTHKEIVKNKESLEKFLSAFIYTLPTNDLGFAAKAATGENVTMLDEICTAAKSPYELRIGSEKLCKRFIKTEKSLDEYARIEKYAEMISSGECFGHHSIAIGLFIADTDTDVRTGLQMYCYSLLSSMVNHAVKLVPLSQLDGQAALNNSMKLIPAAVEKALHIPTDELGISGFGFDLRSMEHEKLYSRIYIS